MKPGSSSGVGKDAVVVDIGLGERLAGEEGATGQTGQDRRDRRRDRSRGVDLLPDRYSIG